MHRARHASNKITLPQTEKRLKQIFYGEGKREGERKEFQRVFPAIITSENYFSLSYTMFFFAPSSRFRSLHRMVESNPDPCPLDRHT